MKKRKNIITGVVLIGIAIYLVMSRMGMLPEIPVFKILISLLLIGCIVDNIKEREFIGITLPLGIIGCLFDNELGITAITPWTLLLVAVLIGIGLDLIFKKKIISVDMVDENGNEVLGGSNYMEDEGRFTIENSMKSTSQYVSINELKGGKIDNGMGNLTVYFNGSNIAPEGATISVDNGMGNVALYFPKDFRVSITYDTALGNVKQFGACSTDESLPLLKLKVDNGVGNVKIYFE